VCRCQSCGAWMQALLALHTPMSHPSLCSPLGAGQRGRRGGGPRRGRAHRLCWASSQRSSGCAIWGRCTRPAPGCSASSSACSRAAASRSWSPAASAALRGLNASVQALPSPLRSVALYRVCETRLVRFLPLLQARCAAHAPLCGPAWLQRPPRRWQPDDISHVCAAARDLLQARRGQADHPSRPRSALQVQGVRTRGTQAPWLAGALTCAAACLCAAGRAGEGSGSGLGQGARRPPSAAMMTRPRKVCRRSLGGSQVSVARRRITAASSAGASSRRSTGLRTLRLDSPARAHAPGSGARRPHGQPACTAEQDPAPEGAWRAGAGIASPLLLAPRRPSRSQPAWRAASGPTRG